MLPLKPTKRPDQQVAKIMIRKRTTATTVWEKKNAFFLSLSLSFSLIILICASHALVVLVVALFLSFGICVDVSQKTEEGTFFFLHCVYLSVETRSWYRWQRSPYYKYACVCVSSRKKSVVKPREQRTSWISSPTLTRATQVLQMRNGKKKKKKLEWLLFISTIAYTYI